MEKQENEDFLIDDCLISFTFEDLKDAYIRKRDLKDICEMYQSGFINIIEFVNLIKSLID